MTRPRLSLAGWRDTLLFLTGLVLIVYEAVLRTGEPRLNLLFLYAGMVGLPAFIRADERRADAPDEPSKEPTA